MSTLRSIARPYAKAAFEYACEQKRLSTWSRALNVLSETISNPDVAAVLKNPNVDLMKCAQVIIEMGKEFFTDEGLKNLLYLLAQKRRLRVLPELSQLFEAYYAEYEKVIHVNVASAYPVSDEQKDKFITALKIRLQRNVDIKFTENKKLIGGAVVTIGEDDDLIIDGSLSSLLARLASNLAYG